MCQSILKWVRTGTMYLPINPQMYILRSEPMLWILLAIVYFVIGESFFEITDGRISEEDCNFYVDIAELLEDANLEDE